MISKAHARFIRVSPRKVRMVVDIVRGKSVYSALSILTNTNKRAAEYVEDILKSAMSNAKRNPDIKDENLYISKMVVDGGPSLKRFRAASMGRASMIKHRTSHITIELDLIPAKKTKAPSPAKGQKSTKAAKKDKTKKSGKKE